PLPFVRLPFATLPPFAGRRSPARDSVRLSRGHAHFIGRTRRPCRSCFRPTISARSADATRIAPIMSRRDSHVLVELARLPWWVSVVVAGVVYVAIRWLSPAIAGDNRFLAPLAHTFSAQARWIAAIFLLPIPFALYHSRHRRYL